MDDVGQAKSLAPASDRQALALLKFSPKQDITERLVLSNWNLS
jgi:hypothetical protein